MSTPHPRATPSPLSVRQKNRFSQSPDGTPALRAARVGRPTTGEFRHFASLSIRRLLLAAAIFTASLGAGTAGAVLFEANHFGGFFGDNFDLSTTVPFDEMEEGVQTLGPRIRTQQAQMIADFDGVGASSYVDSNAFSGINGFTLVVQAHFEDMVFSVDPEATNVEIPPSGTIPVTVRLHLAGLMAINLGGGSATTGVSVRVNDLVRGTHNVSFSPFSGTNESSTGILTVLSGSQIDEIVQYTFDVPLDTPTTVSIGVDAFADLNGQGSVSGFASTNFTDGLRFEPTQPFVLPNGFTVHSMEAGIVDNVVVPEPALALTLPLGAMALLWTRRRRTCELPSI